MERSVTGLVMVAAEVMVTVIREEQHQAALARYAPPPGRNRLVAAELVWCVIPSGRYRGLPTLEVRLDGDRVGELTFPMSQRYGPMVSYLHGHGSRAGCEAVIAHGVGGLRLTARLPRDPTAMTAVPGVAPAKNTFTKHPKAWIGAGSTVAVLFLAAIASGNDEPAVSTSSSGRPTSTIAAAPTTTAAALPPPTVAETTTPPTVADETTDVPPTTAEDTTLPPTTDVAAPPLLEPTEEPAPQPFEAEAAPIGECDPNYGGCVPIASDVDCAGGSGNGPAYVDGPIAVIGADIYDLDRDSDGIACE